MWFGERAEGAEQRVILRLAHSNAKSTFCGCELKLEAGSNLQFTQSCEKLRVESQLFPLNQRLTPHGLQAAAVNADELLKALKTRMGCAAAWQLVARGLPRDPAQ